MHHHENANAATNLQTDRLASLWNHLGLNAAHVAVQTPGDIAGLIETAPERVAGLVICAAMGLDPSHLVPIAPRLVLIAGDRGSSAVAAEQAEQRLPGSRRVAMDDYDAHSWSDCVSDRTETVAAAFRGLPGKATDPRLPPGTGVHAGITYRIQGAGPALVLFPLMLAPSQWDAAIPSLAQQFTVIVLGGRHVGGIAFLEDRTQPKLPRHAEQFG